MKNDEEHLLLCLEDLKPITDQISPRWSGNNQVQTPKLNAFTAVLVLVSAVTQVLTRAVGGETGPAGSRLLRQRLEGGGGAEEEEEESGAAEHGASHWG